MRPSTTIAMAVAEAVATGGRGVGWDSSTSLLGQERQLAAAVVVVVVVVGGRRRPILGFLRWGRESAEEGGWGGGREG